MTPAPRDVQSVFGRALEIESAAGRAAYLDEACGADTGLRAEVEGLLTTLGRAGAFMRQPAAAAMGLTAGYEPATEGPGDVVGRYKLLEQIGEGGFGVVWMAEQQEPVRRQVALKVIKPGMDSKQVLARFEAERQALALMDHPHIAKVLDAGATAGGRPYFVMELVHGVPITEFGDRNRLPPANRLRLFIDVCHAIQHAHHKGVIHRDLKPSNVMVTLHDGVPVVKVIDFGVAKATAQKLTERTLYTGYGQLIGTPAYMSPEQAEMSGLDIDTRSDVYSLGVLLYELLTGTTPLEGKRLQEVSYAELLRLIREEESPRPSTRLSSLGGAATALAGNRGLDVKRLRQFLAGELDWVVLKALNKDRNRRYATPGDFAEDVGRYLRGEPVLACPPSVGYRLRKFVRRNRWPVLAAVLVLLALVGGMIGTTWGMLRATAAQETAQQREQDARGELFLALLNRARARRFSRQPGQRLDGLAALAQAAQIRPDEPLRDEAIAALALPDVRRVPGWHAAPPGTDVLAYGGQYRVYARANARGIISIRSIPDDREIRRIATSPLPGRYLYFSPDERFLVALGDGYTLHVWRVADGQPALRGDLRECRAHAFSPDGRQLAVSRQDWVLCFDLATGREVKRWRLPARACALAFHPDNRKLAVGYFGSNVVSVYDAGSGALVTDLPVGPMTDQVVAWHPDGQRLAVASADPRIQIWNVPAKRKVATLEGHAQRVTVLTFHPDGDLLASYGWDGQLLLWQPSSGRLLLRLLAAGDPQFSADGRWLGVAWDGDRADLLEVTPGREYRTLVSSAGTGQGGYGYGAISPDGRLLAVGMDAGARLWDLRSGREVAALPAQTPFVFFETTPHAPLAPGRRGGAGKGWRLLTSGEGGLRRWPATRDGPEGKRLRLGPPQALSSLRRAWFARGPDGRTLAVATIEWGANQVLDLETGAVRRELGVHPLGEVRALSPDGRWAASSGWHSDRVRLWNVGTGRMAHEWVVGERNSVFFTPDSRALIISRGDEFRFWDVETLQPLRRLRREGPQFPGWVAFSPDGRLMALEMAPGVIHLQEWATGRTVARLEDPFGDRATWQGFTPDGGQLVVVASKSSVVHVWDLRAIRSGLKALGLDWDWPAFPPAAAGSPATESVTVEAGDLAPSRRSREQRAQQAIERGRREVAANPDSAGACNVLAWAYLTAPAALRDVQAALPLAEKAVRLAGGIPDNRNTLALAYYRTGRYREAVETLRPNLKRHDDWELAYDLYLLAMSYHRLGETVRARDYYDWAVLWTAARPAPSAEAEKAEEMARFRAEAEEVLGIKSGK